MQRVRSAIFCPFRLTTERHGEVLHSYVTKVSWRNIQECSGFESTNRSLLTSRSLELFCPVCMRRAENWEVHRRRESVQDHPLGIGVSLRVTCIISLYDNRALRLRLGAQWGEDSSRLAINSKSDIINIYRRDGTWVKTAKEAPNLLKACRIPAEMRTTTELWERGKKSAGQCVLSKKCVGQP